MFDPQVIRAGLAANLAELAAAEGYQVTPYMLAEPTPPFFDIVPDQIDYTIAMQRGGDQNDLLVRAFVGVLLDQGAQIKLDRLLASTGSTSMKTAIESDETLDGACDDLFVARCSGYRVYPKADGRLVLGAQWHVQIETSH